ncbi:MAG: hypothetical protein ACKVX7_15075 [Planctomycetota bacterium]
MSLEFYKLVHIAGVVMSVMAFAGVLACAVLHAERNHPWRKHSLLLHGVGLLVALVGGFGMLAKMKLDFPYPLWIQLKFGIWLALGALVALAGRMPALARIWWWSAVLLVGAAGWLAIHKLD